MPEQGTRNKEQEGIRPGFWKLRAFQKADDLASEVHGLFRQLPSRDNWFRSQILRAGLSVPTNIAEGCGPGTAADRVRFFEIAARSLNEVEYLLHFAARNDILPHADMTAARALRGETARLLFRLIESVRAKARSPEGWQRGMVRDEAANTCLKSTMSIPRVHVLAPNDLSLFPVPCSLFLFPVPCSLFPVPCSLFPVPCSLFPVPCSLFPVPCSLSLFRVPDRR